MVFCSFFVENNFDMSKKIALFASGSGSNVERIARYFQSDTAVHIAAVFCNNPQAGVLQRAENLQIPTFIFDKNEFIEGKVLTQLQELEVDWIVLAGFLWKIPATIIAHFSHKIINIHPALLPKYGGKGMYGMHVHQAVLQNKEATTGITIHFVNEQYDEGAIIFQASTHISDCTTPEDIAAKVHTLEYEHFPVVIENLIKNK